MKKIVLIIIVFLVAIHTNSNSQKRNIRNNKDADNVLVDSVEYKLIIFDPGFETWLAMQPSKNFYSKQYYEQRNRLYTMEWNHRYVTSFSNRYETYIDYDPDTDYGLDLNYKLYYYFKYFEETNKVKLYPSSR